MTAQEFFSRLATVGLVAQLRGVNGTYRYDVEGAGVWRVIVRDGRVEVRPGIGSADCVVTCDANDFVDIVLGRRNIVTAFMQGRLTYEGSIEHLIVQTNLMRLEDMVPSEPAEKQRPQREVRP